MPRDSRSCPGGRPAASWAASTLALSVALLAGCASPSATAPAPAAGDWRAVALPGKQGTQYQTVVWQGRQAIQARSESSASLWRRPLNVPPQQLAHAEWAWWVDGLVSGATVADTEVEDAPARVLFAFAGDESKLSMRTRMMFDLAQAVGGERPPYATLMYVFDAREPVDSLVINGRSDRVRKLVLDSGPAGLRQWRAHRRNLREDFIRAFGEEPGPLIGVAVMTDSDNTRQRASAWYADIRIEGEQPVR